MARAKKKTAGKDAAKGERGASEVRVGGEPAASEGRGLLPFDDLDRLFDDFLKRRWPAPFSMQWPGWRGVSDMLEGRLPSVDVVDEENEIIVKAEVPGVDRKDLEVSVVDRTLTIRGVKREEKKEERKNFYRREIRSGEFTRSVLLPAAVDADKAKANYADGIVELHLPKVEQARRRRISLR